MKPPTLDPQEIIKGLTIAHRIAKTPTIYTDDIPVLLPAVQKMAESEIVESLCWYCDRLNFFSDQTLIYTDFTPAHDIGKDIELWYYQPDETDSYCLVVDPISDTAVVCTHNSKQWYLIGFFGLKNIKAVLQNSRFSDYENLQVQPRPDVDEELSDYWNQYDQDDSENDEPSQDVDLDSEGAHRALSGSNVPNMLSMHSPMQHMQALQPGLPSAVPSGPSGPSVQSAQTVKVVPQAGPASVPKIASIPEPNPQPVPEPKLAELSNYNLSQAQTQPCLQSQVPGFAQDKFTPVVEYAEQHIAELADLYLENGFSRESFVRDFCHALYHGSSAVVPFQAPCYNHVYRFMRKSMCTFLEMLAKWGIPEDTSRQIFGEALTRVEPELCREVGFLR